MPQEYSCFPAPHKVESVKEAFTEGALQLSSPMAHCASLFPSSSLPEVLILSTVYSKPPAA